MVNICFAIFVLFGISLILGFIMRFIFDITLHAKIISDYSIFVTLLLFMSLYKYIVLRIQSSRKKNTN